MMKRKLSKDMRGSTKKLHEGKKILFLKTGGHSVHIAFAKSIGADIEQLSWRPSKGYDIYFVEGGFPKLVLSKILGLISRKAKMVCLFADPRLYYLRGGSYFDERTQKMKKYGFFRKRSLDYFLGKLDGSICVGNFERDIFAAKKLGVPMNVVFPFISKDIQKKLAKVKPSLKEKNIIFVGNGPDWYCKGLHILVSSVKQLNTESFGCKLTILGEWREDIVNSLSGKGIEFLGKRKNVEEYLNNAGIMVHSAIADNFPTSTLEGMAAGLPVLLSESTGTKEIVKNISEDLVVSPIQNDVANALKRYFALSVKERKKLGESFRKEAKKYNEKDMLKLFKEKFNELLGEIYGKEN